MANQNYTVKESVHPYTSCTHPAADAVVDASRAIVNETSGVLSAVVLTMADGTTCTMDIAVGVIYTLSCTATDDAGVAFLY